MRIQLIFVSLLVISVLAFSGLGYHRGYTGYYAMKQVDFNSTKGSSVTICISAVGDLMCHGPEFEYARVAPDSFNFDRYFEFVEPYLKNSDFTFGNLETVTAGKSKIYSGYPLFNSPGEFVSAVKNAGFNLITTSNNHALDGGVPGVFSTISNIKKAGLNYTGTFTSVKDKDSIRIFNIKGIMLAVLAYSYGTNGNWVPKDKAYLINLIDTSAIRLDIKNARESGAKVVMVYFHFGTEYKRMPTDYQKAIVQKTIAAGADLIIGGHPHVIEPAAYYQTENAILDTGFVAYSLGNFISNQRWRYSDAGVILKIFIKEDFETGRISISRITFLPTWVFKGKINNKNEFRILPAGDTLHQSIQQFLSVSDKKDMRQAFYDTKDILTTLSKNIEAEEIIH